MRSYISFGELEELGETIVREYLQKTKGYEKVQMREWIARIRLECLCPGGQAEASQNGRLYGRILSGFGYTA